MRYNELKQQSKCYTNAYVCLLYVSVRNDKMTDKERINEIVSLFASDFIDYENVELILIQAELIK